MATLPSSTRCSAVEARTLAPSSVSLAFAALLSALDRHIACERDLDDVDLFDPAYRSWLDNAEAAQLRLYEALAWITGLAAVRAGDLPLRRMSLLIAALVREGTATAFRRYLQNQDSFGPYLSVPDHGRDSVRARLMLAAAGEKIHALARLSIYRHDGDTDCDADEFREAA